MDIFFASIDHLEPFSELFNQYRIFYEQESNIEAVKDFVKTRLRQGDSAIFIASEQDEMLGFAQLYPSFSSIAMQRVWILNDLYVKEEHRRKGIATRLMDAVEVYAKESGAVRITLVTQIDNQIAQQLYESRGFIRDPEYYHYLLKMT
jgi:ribosomal protein S18 acetylase RimI-like enzyme